MYPHRIISKVPGNITTEPNKEKQGYIGDFSQKTVPQLNELLNRQLKLLANKAFINTLADKGEKIRKLKESIEEELKKHNESENLSRMFSALSMNGKEDLDALEWTGRCAPGHVAAAEEGNISDDETDPFRILATHSGAGFHKKKLRVIKPGEPLIKPSDIEDGKSKEQKENDNLNAPEEEVLEEYAKHLCEKMDLMKTTDHKTKFLPHRTLKGSNERKEGEGKKGRGKWEVTAATPPPPVHGDAKMVSLQESLRLQLDQQQKFKEIQTRHAAERLMASAAGYSLTIGPVSQPMDVGDYRDPASGTSSEDEGGSENEVHDEEEPDGGGVVIYNLVDDHENG